MKYRKMGSLPWEVSALGFGCMRLPTRRLVPRVPKCPQHIAIPDELKKVTAVFEKRASIDSVSAAAARP